MYVTVVPFFTAKVAIIAWVSTDQIHALYNLDHRASPFGPERRKDPSVFLSGLVSSMSFCMESYSSSNEAPDEIMKGTYMTPAAFSNFGFP